MHKSYCLISILAILVTGCSNESAAPGGPSGGMPAIMVIATPVVSENVVDEIQALGTARANESIEITPRISSLIAAIKFTEGQLVHEGDILIELENREIRAGLAVAEATLDESRKQYDRSKSLASSQAISASTLDEQQASVRVDSATVEMARARLANTVIRAPFSGHIGLRRVSLGEFVDSSTVITTLDDTDRIKLDFSIPEAFLTAISEGMSIVAASAVYPEKSFIGTVSSIDTRLDPISRSVMVRALVPNPDNLLKPGMFLTVSLQRDRGNVLVIPEEAIVPEGGQQFVFVVKGDKVVKQRVELGHRVPGRVEVTSGLSEGEQVVTEGTQKVRDGSLVQVLPANTATDMSATGSESADGD